MDKQEMIQFMNMAQEKTTGPVMEEDVGKAVYKCSNCNAMVKRIDHHIRKHHANPRTKGKKCILLSLYVLMYGCIHVGTY